MDVKLSIQIMMWSVIYKVINYNIRANNFNLITNKFKNDQLQH